jgi:hypothetical protein
VFHFDEQPVEAGGFTDWYLPSKNELNLLWGNLFNVNKSLSAISGAAEIFSSNNFGSYWSSSEDNSFSSWLLSYSGSLDGLSIKPVMDDERNLERARTNHDGQARDVGQGKTTQPAIARCVDAERSRCRSCRCFERGVGVYNAFGNSGTSRSGDHECIAGLDLSTVKSVLYPFRINEQRRGEDGEERIPSSSREARVKGQHGVAALPGLREGLDKALSGLGDRHQFLHRG